jgi:hypothetical protein
VRGNKWKIALLYDHFTTGIDSYIPFLPHLTTFQNLSLNPSKAVRFLSQIGLSYGHFNSKSLGNGKIPGRC